MKKLYMLLCAALMVSVMSSCNKKDENEGYCLMYYFSGGDYALDSIFISQRNAIEDKLQECENISVTYLFKSSNVNDNLYRLIGVICFMKYKVDVKTNGNGKQGY